MVLWWFGANMAGQRNKNAFKFLLQLLILSQKHILGVKKVVWDGLDVVWGGLEVVWGGLWCFGVVWGVSTDPNWADNVTAEQNRANFWCWYPVSRHLFSHVGKFLGLNQY